MTSNTPYRRLQGRFEVFRSLPRALVLALWACLIWAALGVGAPPSRHEAGNTEFSASRALPSLYTIASAPHPSGSPEQARVRAYIAKQLQALGMEVELQRAVVGGREVENIVARMRGRVAGSALMMAAHYDSVAGSPGAADNGVAVASVLEVLRALQAGAPLRNDVLCLFTDAEEQGLLGARAFVAGHPWLADVAVTLNLDARGNRGPWLMFETSPSNGMLIAALAALPGNPQASSLYDAVYRRLPNDTDFSVYRRAGLPGMNFGMVAGASVYHTMQDRAAAVDEDSVQQLGTLILELARHLGNMPLGAATGPDQIYFNLPWFGLVHYPRTWNLPLTIGTSLALAVLIAVAGRRWHWLASARAAFLVAGATTTLGAGFELVRRLSAGTRVADLDDGPAWGTAACLLSVAVVALLARRVPPASLARGAVLCIGCALPVFSAVLPGGSYLLTWPLLAALPGLSALCWNAAAARWLLMAGTGASLVLAAPLARDLCAALGPAAGAPLVILSTLLLAIAGPCLAPREAFAPAAT